MYVEKKDVTLPEDKKVKVWRYMSFTKFVDLLSTKELFFSRPDGFNDPFEGGLTKPTSKKVDDLFSSKLPGKNREEFGNFIKSFRNIIGINCWHLNNTESDAMWKLYLSDDDGVAIQSTFERLSGSLEISKQEIFLACVNYVNYEEHIFNFNDTGFNFIELFTHKRASFEHEKELRAIIINKPNNKSSYNGPLVKELHENVTNTIGDRAEVDINLLIENVYISPLSSSWFKELVIKTIEQFGYDFKIKSSTLQEKPFY